MAIIYDLDELKSPLKNPVLTIGNFDGVHRGHVALFEKVKERAESLGGQSALMTFEPHPLKVMRPGNGPRLITTTRQKLELISDTGIEVIFCLPFTTDFAAISAREFIEDILVRKIGIKEIVVGYDYTFGHNREGNIQLLREAGEELGFAVHVMGPVHIDGSLVSSTSIRRLVQEGKLPEANRLLGRAYQICGTVVRGKNRGGRLLGIPTANLKIADELTPKTGVYAVTVLVDGRTYPGVTNIGFNPTFGNGVLSVETHLLDFSGDLLGRTITLTFLERIRDERTFESINDLARQIARDILQARAILQKKKSG